MSFSRPGGRRAALCVALLVALPASAATERVEVPLVVPHEFLGRLLVEQVFTDPGPSAEMEAAADPCSEIVLTEPTLRAQGGRIHVGAHGSALAGFTLLGWCWQPFGWEGRIDAEQEPRLAKDAAAVEFHVVDSQLTNDDGGVAVSRLWRWVKPAVHPRLDALRVDLEPLLRELRRALPLFAEQRDDPTVQRLADSLRLARVRIEERGLVLVVRFDVETLPAEQQAIEPEPPLTPEEIAAFEATLHQWDAFLTFVIKHAGQETLDPSLRAALLEVLLDARYEIVTALEEPGRDGSARVRALFQASWKQLQPALATLTGSSEGFRYLAFLAAGDALSALDQAGPAFGVEISSDGLRRLARTLAPQASEDALRWNEDVDPTLRATFGFDAELPPVPPPPPPDTEAEIEPEVTPEPEPIHEPVAPPAEEPAPGAFLWHFANLLWPAAAATPVQIPDIGPETSDLDAFVPRIADLDAYLPKVAKILREAADSVLGPGRLAAVHHETFRDLVLATAWKESCWRQYVMRRGKAVPLRSNRGALGIMQVNPRVWRGFFSVDGLSWSVAYNARAGGEVLLHYFRDYALERGEAALGGPDALARAAYAAYNGGPSHLRRYREPKRWARSLTVIDRDFYANYRAIAAGEELGVRACFPG